MPDRRQFLCSAVALGIGGSYPRLANAEDTPITGAADANLAPFDDLLTKFLKDNELPGTAAAVTRNGKLVYARGFGYSDVENKKAVEPAALFRIASVSKPITAVGVLKLVDAGKVKLGDPVLKYVKLEPFVPED